MKVIIYRNNDRPFSLFGIKGMFIAVFISSAVVITLLAFLIAAVSYAIAGLLFWLSVLFLMYLVISLVQGRYREKDISRMLNSIRMPSFIIIRRKIWKR